jgi:prepilin-type processing-associated H-X9-DG protein
MADHSQTDYSHIFSPNSRIPDCYDSWDVTLAEGACSARSEHPGAVNVAFGDGSVRFVGQEIDLKVWRALGTMNGREIVPNNF